MSEKFNSTVKSDKQLPYLQLVSFSNWFQFALLFKEYPMRERAVSDNRNPSSMILYLYNSSTSAMY